MINDQILIILVQSLTSEFTVPCYVIGGHILEVGRYYLHRTMRDEEQTQIVAAAPH